MTAGRPQECTACSAAATRASACANYSTSLRPGCTAVQVIAHMMPDLPNVGWERDLESFAEFFENPTFRSDGLKVCSLSPAESQDFKLTLSCRMLKSGSKQCAACGSVCRVHMLCRRHGTLLKARPMK